MTTCPLPALRSRIVGVHLHVLEEVVTFAFSWLLQRHFCTLLAQAGTMKLGLVLGVYPGHDFHVEHQSLT
jgi:hypothetical protein